MKKLESLKNEKFTVSDSELNQIKGGYGTGTTTSYTYRADDTDLSGGGSTVDLQYTDTYVDFH